MFQVNLPCIGINWVTFRGRDEGVEGYTHVSHSCPKLTDL